MHIFAQDFVQGQVTSNFSNEVGSDALNFVNLHCNLRTTD